MFMGDIFGALRRQWILALLCLVLALSATLLTVQRSKPTYSYSSTLLLLPPKVSRVTDPSTPDYTHGNPLFFLNSLDQTRDILIGSMTSGETQEEVADRFGAVTYTVTPDILGSGPVIVVTAEATSDAAAAAAREELVKLVPDRLTKLQSQVGVETSAMITATAITDDATPAISHKAQVRSAITTFGALVVLALFFIGIVDALRVARSNRRRRKSAEQGDLDPSAEDDEAGARPVSTAANGKRGVVARKERDADSADALVPSGRRAD